MWNETAPDWPTNVELDYEDFDMASMILTMKVIRIGHSSIQQQTWQIRNLRLACCLLIVRCLGHLSENTQSCRIRMLCL